MWHLTKTALPTLSIRHDSQVNSVIVLSARGTTQAMRTGFARCWFVSSQSVVRQGTPMSSVESKGVLCVSKSCPKRKRWRHNSSSPVTLIYNSPATSQRLTPEFANQHLTAAYLFTVLCLYAVAYTVFNIPYLALPAEMTDSYHERSSIHAYRIVFVSIGGLLAVAGVNALLERLGKNSPDSYAIVGMVCSAFILARTMISYLSTASVRKVEPRERPTDIGFGLLLDE